MQRAGCERSDLVDVRRERRLDPLRAARAPRRRSSGRRVRARRAGASTPSGSVVLEAQVRGVADRELEAAAAEVEAERAARRRARRGGGTRRRSAAPPPGPRGCARRSSSARPSCSASLRPLLRVAQRGGRDRDAPPPRRRARAARPSRRAASTARSQVSGGITPSPRDRRAEPQHLALARDPLEVSVGRRVGDDHVERRAAEVGDGDADLLALGARAERVARRRDVRDAQRLAVVPLEHPGRALRARRRRPRARARRARASRPEPGSGRRASTARRADCRATRSARARRSSTSPRRAAARSRRPVRSARRAARPSAGSAAPGSRSRARAGRRRAARPGPSLRRDRRARAGAARPRATNRRGSRPSRVGSGRASLPTSTRT